MSRIGILKFLFSHPLTKRHKLKTLTRFFRWQIGSRLVPGAVATPFVNDIRMLAEPGMTGATGNTYAGLHEFEDMCFLLHMLRHEDLFVDIGANIGSYTLLASGAVGAQSIAIEPIPRTFRYLTDNINLNNLQPKVTALNIGLGGENCLLRFTSELDTINHVVSDSDACHESIEIQVKTLDEILSGALPKMIKIDVEGFEEHVIQGGHMTLSNQSLQAVLVELNGAGARYCSNESEIHAKMIGYGFEPYRYSPFERKLISLEGRRLYNGNTLYLRTIHKIEERLSASPRFDIRNVETSV